ncbi:MAG: response regulator transcription factor [Actinomycetota bacterium]|nr:response regulator transcription factor [Actinomycetota bacterium]
MSQERLSVVIVDDHAIFRAGVRAELIEGVDVAGEAATVEDAVGLIARARPDVVLLDVHMPDGGGLEVIRRVAAAPPDTGPTGGGSPPRFLALSVSDDPEDVVAIIRAGARGYVTKTISGPDLIDAIGRIHQGDAVFSPQLAGFVLDAFASADPAPGQPASDPELDLLTPREQEVMRLIARGYMYKEIARRLEISVKTVEAHSSAVLRKLQLSTRHELSRWAAERDLID